MKTMIELAPDAEQKLRRVLKILAPKGYAKSFRKQMHFAVESLAEYFRADNPEREPVRRARAYIHGYAHSSGHGLDERFAELLRVGASFRRIAKARTAGLKSIARAQRAEGGRVSYPEKDENNSKKFLEENSSPKVKLVGGKKRKATGKKSPKRNPSAKNRKIQRSAIGQVK